MVAFSEGGDERERSEKEMPFLALEGPCKLTLNKFSDSNLMGRQSYLFNGFALFEVRTLISRSHFSFGYSTPFLSINVYSPKTGAVEVGPDRSFHIQRHSHAIYTSKPTLRLSLS